MIGDIKHFRFWCQKVLPLVYDNSLSYYEVLCKVSAKLNELINNVNDIPEYIDAKIEEAFDEDHILELLSQFIAKIQSAISANNEGTNVNSSKDYNVGQMLWLNDTLYRVIRPISAGATFIVNTNIEAVDFETLFNDFVDEIKHDITANDDGTSATATQNWTAGQWLWLNDELYKVVNDITQGNAYVFSGDNANVSRITVEDEFTNEKTARINSDISLDNAIDAVDTKVGLLANLETSDKTDIVSAINEICDGIEKSDMYVTFEDFGAVGDGVNDDTNAITDAIQYGVDNNKIISSLGKTYLISSDITIPRYAKLHHIGVITTNNANTITLTNGSEIVYGYFDKVKLITFGYFTKLQHIKIRDISAGYAIHIKGGSGFTTEDVAKQKVNGLYDDIMLINTADSTATGIYCECPDTFMYNIEVVNFLVGYRLASENKLINCNCWLNNVITDFDNTIAFKIAGQGVRLVNCTSDTIALAISVPSQYYSVVLNGFEIYFNSTIKTNCTFKFINYYGDYSGELVVHLPNASANNNKFYLQYQSHLHVSMIDGNAEDYSPVANSATSSQGGTVSQLNCKHNSDIFVYKMTITYSTPLANGTYDTITMDKVFADQKSIAMSWNSRYFVPCKYNDGTIGLAQLDMRYTDFQVHSVNPPSGTTGISEIYVNIVTQGAISAI